MVGRYGPHNPDETYVEHKYPEQLFDTGELRLNYATAGEASNPAVLLVPGQTESWWGYEAAMDLLKLTKELGIGVALDRAQEIAYRAHALKYPKEKLEELAHRVRGKISQFIYAEGDTSMEEVVGRLFIERKLTMAVAESCTGGLIGHRITNVPGCSQYFKGDLVTYTYDVKEGVLGVSDETLKAHGAVSEECVREMAAGVRKRTGASVSVATSGIAGPDGGTPDKPVGTVCIALSADDQSFTRRYQFRGTRDWIKLITSQVALDWLRRYALGLPIADSTLFRR